MSTPPNDECKGLLAGLGKALNLGKLVADTDLTVWVLPSPPGICTTFMVSGHELVVDDTDDSCTQRCLDGTPVARGQDLKQVHYRVRVDVMF